MLRIEFLSTWNWFRDQLVIALPVSLALGALLLFARPLKADAPGSLPPEQEPLLSFSCETVQYVEPMIRPKLGRPTNFFFVEDQVILFGSREDVNDTIEEMRPAYRAQWQGFDLRLNRDCTLRFPQILSQDRGLDPAYFPFTAVEQDELVLRLYDVDFLRPLSAEDQTNRVLEVVRFVNRQTERRVFADPNYIIGALGASQCGHPHEPDGSPHEPDGSPFEAYATHHERSRSQRPDEPVGEAPNAPPHEPGGQPQAPPGLAGSSLVGDYPTAKASEFWDQWALEHIGLGPFSEYLLAANLDAPTGARVHVAVFDTSPFTPSLGYEEINASGDPVYYAPDPQLIDWPNRSGITETFSLKLAFSNNERLEEVQSGVVATATNVTDHGLFVSSLVHAVAPDSQVELIRVLNDYGCGDLQTLNESLIDFIVKQDTERLGLQGVVMNLSLGIQKPRSLHGLVGKNELISLTGLTTEDLETLVKDDLDTLAAVLSVAHSRKGVVLAAAGNDSTQTRALPMHLPADYPFVMGISASTIDRERACFSNWGDIAAPGGDGRPSVNNPTDRPCLPAHSVAAGGSATVPGARDVADASIIGLASRLPDSQAGDPSPPPYYRYWSGTSFSAPLVSGLAALVLDASFDGTSWLSPDQVFEAIRCGSPPPDGVVNVPVTLSPRCLPNP